jgi:hypothetical protein
VYEAQNDCGGFAGGIGSNFPFNHLWPLVAGGGGMTKDEALELALEALEMYLLETNSDFQRKAVRAIKQALAAPMQASQIQSDVQEALFEATYPAGRPLAPLVAIEGNAGRHVIDAITPPAAQRQWVGLTDEEISEAYNAASKKALYRMGATRDDVYEAIESKLKEKNNG